LILLSIIFLSVFGLVGITIGFMVNYFIYLIILLGIFKRYFSDYEKK